MALNSFLEYTIKRFSESVNVLLKRQRRQKIAIYEKRTVLRINSFDKI